MWQRISWLALAVTLGMGIGLPVDASPTTKSPVLATRGTGFQLISNRAVLEGSALDATCQNVLQQPISCDEYVASLGQKTYRGSLDNAGLTNIVCSASCERALTTARRRILGACSSTPELIPGYPVIALIESVITGWNETCLRDKDSTKFCNDIIASQDDYADIKEIPESQLCSYCFGAKLRMMQQSPYSAYDDLFADMLEYVNKQCGVKTPTTTLPEPIHVNGTQADECFSGNMYTTRDGDTCDSIALAHSISAATLYYLNGNLINCALVPAGLLLCLPESCKTLYRVQEKDKCVKVAVDEGTGWTKLLSWNLALDSRCSNLWSINPFWGRVICVSPPGGEYEYSSPSGKDDDGGKTGNGDIGGEGGSGDGYSNKRVDPPEGIVAKGTTQKCGQYVQAKEGVSCPSMLSTNAVPMDLFLKANPSLGTVAQCDGKLILGVWYCLHPLRRFDGGNGGK